MIRFFSFCIVSFLLFFTLILLSSTSCSNINSPGGSFVVNKGGEVIEDSDGNTANKEKEFEEELNVVVNDFFTVDKKKKELLYRFNPNAWFCAKRSVPNIQKHAVGFPIDLALDGDEYFAAVFLDTRNISLAPYQEKIAISKILNGIYPTNISRVLPTANFNWSNISAEFSNQKNFFDKVRWRSFIKYRSGAFYIDEHPVLAFLPHASEPGMLVHFYVYNKSYKFKVDDVVRTVVNPYTTSFIEIVPALIYHNGALDSNGVEILLSLALHVDDFSSLIRVNLTDERFVKIMKHSLVSNNFFKNGTKQRGGHEYPLAIKIVFPKHAGRTKTLACK